MNLPQVWSKYCTSPRLVQIHAEALDKGQQLEHIGAPVANDPNTLNPPTLCPNIRWHSLFDYQSATKCVFSCESLCLQQPHILSYIAMSLELNENATKCISCHDLLNEQRPHDGNPERRRRMLETDCKNSLTWNWNKDSLVDIPLPEALSWLSLPQPLPKPSHETHVEAATSHGHLHPCISTQFPPTISSPLPLFF